MPDPQLLDNFNRTLPETKTARERKRLEDKFPFEKAWVPRVPISGKLKVTKSANGWTRDPGLLKHHQMQILLGAKILLEIIFGLKQDTFIKQHEDVQVGGSWRTLMSGFLPCRILTNFNYQGGESAIVTWKKRQFLHLVVFLAWDPFKK